MKINTNNITSASMSNPLIVVIVLLLILIIILAIFRSASPFLNVGLEVNAHIGDLRSSFQIVYRGERQGLEPADGFLVLLTGDELLGDRFLEVMDLRDHLVCFTLFRVTSSMI